MRQFNVSGIEIQSARQTTDPSGYVRKASDARDVEVYLGTTRLGPRTGIPQDDTISLASLGQSKPEQMVNIATFLDGADDDANFENGVQVSPAVAAVAKSLAPVDLSRQFINLYSDPSVLSAVSALQSASTAGPRAFSPSYAAMEEKLARKLLSDFMVGTWTISSATGSTFVAPGVTSWKMTIAKDGRVSFDIHDCPDRRRAVDVSKLPRTMFSVTNRYHYRIEFRELTESLPAACLSLAAPFINNLSLTLNQWGESYPGNFYLYNPVMRQGANHSITAKKNP